MIAGLLKKKEINPPSELKQMEASLYPAICAPFNGRKIWIIARELNFVQIKSCGDFSLIETIQDNINNKDKKPTLDDMVKYSEIQHNVVKESLLNPKYDDIIKMILKYDDIDLQKQLNNIQRLFDKLPDKIENKKEKNELKEKYALLELKYRYILPADFLGFVFSFALKIDSSDIKKVSEEMLYNAAIKAKLGNDNPADHLTGDFTKFNIEDINERGWDVYFKKHPPKK